MIRSFAGIDVCNLTAANGCDSERLALVRIVIAFVFAAALLARQRLVTA